MTLLASFLILLYCIGHSYWNFLVKKSDNPQIMLVLIALGSWILFFPLALIYLFINPISIESWLFIIINSILQIFYYAFLGKAYKLADLSIVYPLARGSAVFFIPIWGVLFFNESISSSAMFGISLVFIGLIFISVIPIINKDLLITRNLIVGIILSVLVGLNISFYTIVDKKAVSSINPFIYPILITVGGSLGAIMFTGSKNKILDLKFQFQNNYKTVIIGSTIMYLAYSVMLYALNISKMSYAATTRELTIMVGIIWSYFFLKEKINLTRFLAILVIFSGAIIISFSN
ncbi:MAG: DMT family transporter [Chloroflexota bacterium]|nr:DMT family transporter [Chloroflexota bacterium]